MDKDNKNQDYFYFSNGSSYETDENELKSGVYNQTAILGDGSVGVSCMSVSINDKPYIGIQFEPLKYSNPVGVLTKEQHSSVKYERGEMLTLSILSSNVESLKVLRTQLDRIITYHENKNGRQNKNIIIAGGRDFTRDVICNESLNRLIDNEINSMFVESVSPTIINGTAKGADTYGEFYAYNHRKCDVLRFEPEWDRYGKAAGTIRNGLMEEKADAAVIFWDGMSSGTRDMINKIKYAGKPYCIIFYRNEQATVGSDPYTITTSVLTGQIKRENYEKR